MNFSEMVKTDSNTTSTTNGMKALVSSLNNCVDLFFKAGAMRGQDIIPVFDKAYHENREYALRIAMWLRDIRGGAGERSLYKDIIKHLEKTNPDDAKILLDKIPLIGRFDDLLSAEELKEHSFNIVKKALDDKNGLAAKWMPRKGKIANELRNFLKLSPKAYRKLLVSLTNVVETKMCENAWDEINYNHVPSIASRKYSKAFARHSENYKAYLEEVESGKSKINASAIFPHDVLKNVDSNILSDEERTFINEQWKALTNNVGSSNILPVIDLSGSMETEVSNGLEAIHIAISLGLYFATKNTGVFNGVYSSFSSKASLRQLSTTNVVDSYHEVKRSSDYCGSTNIEAVFDLILERSLHHNIKQEDMPEYIIIFSDMQFDDAVDTNKTAHEMIMQKYETAGYKIPKIIFWNLVAHNNVPVSFDENGTAMVSGYSSVIAKSIINTQNLSPIEVMKSAIMVERYMV